MQNILTEFSWNTSRIVLLAWIIIVSLFIIFIIVRIKYIEWRIAKPEKSSPADQKMLSPENFKETQELIGREYKPSYPEKYYQYLREEIEREDNITNQRLTWTITFQGFLINAMAFLFVFFWDTSIGIYFVRKLALIAIGFIGLQIGFITYIGVMASRDSIRRAKINWTWRDEIWKLYPNSVPQTFGQGNTFHGGTIHAERIPRLFIWMWSAYLIGYITLISVFEIYPYGSLQGVSPESFFECLYNQRTGGSSTSILKYLFDLWNGN